MSEVKKDTRFGKGNPGKKKGCKDKLTRSIKEAIERAFEQVGGASYLVKVAQEDPRTFCALLGKIIPQQMAISGVDGGPAELTVRFVKSDG